MRGWMEKKVTLFGVREESVKMLIIVGLVTVAPILVLLFFMHSDLFYRKAFPKKYWAEKVRNLELEIQGQEALLQLLGFWFAKKPSEIWSTTEEWGVLGRTSGMKPEEIESIQKRIIEGGHVEVEELKLKIEFTKKGFRKQEKVT